jgi:hypothetical protein
VASCIGRRAKSIRFGGRIFPPHVRPDIAQPVAQGAQGGYTVVVKYQRLPLSPLPQVLLDRLDPLYHTSLLLKLLYKEARAVPEKGYTVYPFLQN